MKRHLVYLSQNVDINPSMGIFTNRILYSEVRYGKITDYYEKCSVSPVIGTVFCHADKSREQTSKQHSAPKLIAKTREEKFAEIEEKAGLITRIYDTVITGNGKVMPVDAFVISGRTICGYAGSPKANEAETARYIKEMLQNSHVDKVTVKIFCDYVAFLSRAEGMNNIATVESGGEGNREAKIKQLILSTSM